MSGEKQEVDGIEPEHESMMEVFLEDRLHGAPPSVVTGSSRGESCQSGGETTYWERYPTFRTACILSRDLAQRVSWSWE